MDDTDDYLSDAFLTQATSQDAPLSYAERRKQTRRESERKNLQNRKRSRKDLEEEALREGLNKSLFEREQEERASSITANGNKAMSMMLKMGFKVGQPLGKLDEAALSSGSISNASTAKPVGHRTEPVPIHIWSGGLA